MYPILMKRWFLRKYGAPEVYLNGKKMIVRGWRPWYPWWLRLLQWSFPDPGYCFSRAVLEKGVAQEGGPGGVGGVVFLCVRSSLRRSSEGSELAS